MIRTHHAVGLLARFDIAKSGRHLLCRIFGHPTEAYVYGKRLDRFGRLRDVWGSRCKRCRCSGAAAYEIGILQAIPERWREFRQWLHFRVFSRCCDCGKPQLILGRLTGEHDTCIPF